MIFILMLLLSVLISCIIGMVYAVVGRSIDIVPFFQLIIAILIYAAATLPNKRLDSGIAKVLVAVLLGLTTCFAYIYTGYCFFRSDVGKSLGELTEQYDVLTAEDTEFRDALIDAASDMLLKEQTGYTGLTGYVIFNAQNSTFKKLGVGSSYDGAAKYLLQLLKMAIIVTGPAYAFAKLKVSSNEADIKTNISAEG